MRRLTQEHVDTLKSFGYDVYLFSDPHWHTYAFFVDDQGRLGHVQRSFGGFSFSTCHVPNKDTGTGFHLNDGVTLTKENCEQAFVFAPAWAKPSEVRSVVKHAPDSIAALMEAKRMVKQ